MPVRWQDSGVPRATYYWQIKHGIRNKTTGELVVHGRFSGSTYENPPERLAQIAEKYKNGVTPAILEEMMEDLI